MFYLRFVLHQTSPRAVRLLRDHLGIAFVPSKNGMHKPEHGLKAVGVGILESVIKILPNICTKASYGRAVKSEFVIGPVAVQYDGTALTAVVKWIAFLNCLEIIC